MADEGVSKPDSEEIKPIKNASALVHDDKFKQEKIQRPRKTHLLQWMEITVTEPEKKTIASMKMQDTFVVYLIETRVTDEHMQGFGEGATSVWRRYSEFELLRNYLDVTFPAVIVPALPEKKATYAWQNVSMDRFDPDFIERRRAGLEIFLLRCAAHPKLCQDKIFMGFLQQEQGWRETVNATDFYSKAESRLKALNAQFKIKKSDRRFDELKNYCTELQSNIGNILKIRARMCDKLYGIHKVHGNYARVFNEWSAIEKDIAEHLQSASHYMDVFASSIDAQLEEEEQYADQLKEYYSFGDSVRSVCRRYECAQYDLEKAEDNLTYKIGQRDLLKQAMAESPVSEETSNQGKSGFSLSGMKSKIFGSEAPEQREVRLKQLEEQIVQAEAELKKVQEETDLFVEQALRDIDRFQRQKTKDLQEIFTNYAVMQIKQCKKGIAIWISAKDCFSKM
ncbi:sorting nexin-4-like isoform X2 [Biomphalaria glabrata]|uniref:Sorting nexin-4-like isoform X2 n=1 Tax=Biomphalaria glabrata TaxID=6526 RepID=A0A2C9K746_BIOGL|nr:sorting nexin-4-like isoform X2 [Biomphalaria glabrata]